MSSSAYSLRFHLVPAHRAARWAEHGAPLLSPSSEHLGTANARNTRAEARHACALAPCSLQRVALPLLPVALNGEAAEELRNTADWRRQLQRGACERTLALKKTRVVCRLLQGAAAALEMRPTSLRHNPKP